MKQRRLVISLAATVCLAALVWWISSHTYWAETKVPMPLKGEALTNPFYAAQRFAEALGARTAWDRIPVTPPRDAVIVLSTWQWNVSAQRRQALERWVESGGRLVVDATLAGQGELERWSGVVRTLRHDDEDEDVEEYEEQPFRDSCRSLRVEREASPAGEQEPASYSVCNLEADTFLTSGRRATWALRDGSRAQAIRVAVGRGSVTIINALPFRYRQLLDGDHDRLFVAATQLRRGDEVHFLSEDDHPSLLALVWRHGAPVVGLGLAIVALLLWRGGVRFGPLAAPPQAARRSLAEQIRGTGQFALRHGDGEALHAACVRALEETVQRRVKGYARLPATERATALERLTGFNGRALMSAIHHPDSRRAGELRRTLARLEAARRHLLIDRKGRSHGTR